MSEQILNPFDPFFEKIPESMNDNGKTSFVADVLGRLEKLEDSFLTGLQEIRAVKSELKKRADSVSGLEKLLDAKAVAELLGEKEQWVYRQAKAKKIPSVKLGKYWKFSPSELQKWLERKSIS